MKIKFFILLLFPFIVFAIPQWSNWQDIPLGNYSSYSNVVAKDPTHAYVILSEVIKPTDTDKTAKAYLYQIDLTTKTMTRVSIVKLSISDYDVPMNLILDNNGVPYVAYRSYNGNQYELSVARLKIDGSWEIINNNIADLSKDYDLSGNIQLLCNLVTNDIYLLFNRKHHSRGTNNLGVLVKQEDSNGVRWNTYGGNNSIQMTGPFSAKIVNSSDGGDNLIIAYSSYDANSDLLDYDLQVAKYNQQKGWEYLSTPSPNMDVDNAYHNFDVNKFYLDVDYNGALTLSYAVSYYFTDTWATIANNGQWQHALNSNYKHLGLSAPQWFTGKDGSYVFSYVALGVSDRSHYYYYSQIYYPATGEWSNPVANATAINPKFPADYATTYYDKIGANNNLFAIVEADWSGSGKQLLLAERHALAN